MDIRHVPWGTKWAVTGCQMEFLHIVLGDAGQSMERRTSWGGSGETSQGISRAVRGLD